uniref:Uncharacterized protein n=1 Tax=Macaca nemestrina TaxID=9545 RepID=A0A2K6DAW7_MACNE
MPQPDALSSLMVSNEAAPGPCGPRVSWQCLHGKCFSEMCMADPAQPLLCGSKVLLNEQMGWYSPSGTATPWAKVSHCLSGRLRGKKSRVIHGMMDGSWHQNESCLG